MGKYDSSRTRVVPVFNGLMERDSTGNTWLPRLLKLGSLSSRRLDGLDPGPLIAEHPRWWGEKERSLDPPKALLCWLVENLQMPESGSFEGSDVTRDTRKLLAQKDPATIAEALHLAAEMPKPRAWYILEGQSRPDACLETESLILVIEGKRTKREPATTTTWMPQRSQMIRHMDAAWKVRAAASARLPGASYFPRRHRIAQQEWSYRSYLGIST